MSDPQWILDQLERGDLDVEAALRSFEGAPAPRTTSVARSADGKIILADVHAPPSTPPASAPRRIHLAATEPQPAARPEGLAFPRAGRPVVSLTMIDGAIALVRMEDRDAANMFTHELLAGLREAFAAIEESATAKVVVITGVDSWFCCGGTPEDLALMKEGRASFFDIEGFRLPLDCTLPTIAAMQGHALGGGLTFGLYADVALLADSAYYSTNFMEHDLTPGVGTTYIVPKKLGEALGAEMMLTARRYQGRDLKARGVALEVLKREDVLDRAFELAREIAKKPLLQLKLLKKRSTHDTRRDLPRVLREEDAMHARCFPRPLSAPRERPSDEAAVAYQTILVEGRGSVCTITLNRPAANNGIDEQLLEELHGALDVVERDPATKVIVLRGQPPVFCTGLDFQAFTASGASAGPSPIASRYIALLKRLTLTPKIVIAAVDGQVLAGGIGLVAASDFAFATPQSTFGLSEALWGLLPAMVLPFLIRRVGVGSAYAMTLGTETLDSGAARAMRLVDDVIDPAREDLARFVEKKAKRLGRLDSRTVAELKAYFRELWIVDDGTERRALTEINRLLADPRVQTNIRNYTEHGQMPWERETEPS